MEYKKLIGINMKHFNAFINITLRKGILDVQGKTIENALHSIDFPMLTDVRLGKYVTLHVEADDDAKASLLVTDACKKLIANPIIEDFEIKIIEI